MPQPQPLHPKNSSKTETPVDFSRQKVSPAHVFTTPVSTSPPISPCKILHVRVVANQGGGPDKTIFRSAHALNPSRYHMTAAYIYPQGSKAFSVLKKAANHEHCPLVPIPEKGPLDLSTFRRLKTLCMERNIQIWHAHDYKSNLLGLLMKRQIPALKLVSTVHGWTWDTLRSRCYYHLDNYCLKRYSQVVVVSPKLYEHCLALGIKPARLTYIPNAIRLADYDRPQAPTLIGTENLVAANASQRARQALKIPPRQWMVGVIGRLSVEKGVDRAIRAITQIPQAHLHLVGDGPQRKKLQTLAKQLHIQHRVTFWGWQTSLKQFYEAMDLLLLPSLTEGLPNVVLEAMAMRVPVAATDVGAVRDLLDNGQCGLILPVASPERWSSLIQSLRQNHTQQQRFIHLARLRVETRFTFASRMTQMMQVYDRLMGYDQTAVPRQAA